MNKKKLFYIFLIVLFSIALFTWFYLKNRQPDPKTSIIIPTASLPTEKPGIPAQISPFTLLATRPPLDSKADYAPIAFIEFTFSKTVNPKTLYYKISPETDIYIKTKGNKLTIYPDVAWQDGENSIMISDTSLAADGTKIDKSYEYKFKVKAPEDPPEDFEL